MMWTKSRRSRVNSLYASGDHVLLYIAANEGNVEMMSQLLSQRVDVNQVLMSSRHTPLHIAASEEKSLEVVKMLVEAGADVNRRDECGFTALMYACLHGHESIGSYLVRNCADVNASNVSGMTPLLFAIGAPSLSVPQISTLLKAKACVNVCDSNGMTPLHAIIKRIGRFHVDARWDVMELLLSYPCDINAKEKFEGVTPLHTAMCCNDQKAALMLIKAGCKVDIEDRSGRVPMSHAIDLKRYALVELLLAAGERIPCEDWMGIKRLLEKKDPSMLERLMAVVVHHVQKSLLRSLRNPGSKSD